MKYECLLFLNRNEHVNDLNIEEKHSKSLPLNWLKPFRINDLNRHFDSLKFKLILVQRL